MDGLASFIGWVVIVIAGLYFVGKVLNSFQEEKGRALERKLSVDSYLKSLSLRKIYSEEGTEEVKGLVIREYPCWALLELDLGDEAYRVKQLEFDYQSYLEAVSLIEKNGYPYVMRGGGIDLIWYVQDGRVTHRCT